MKSNYKWPLWQWTAPLNHSLPCALSLCVTADFCFGSPPLPHPSISSLVRQCEIVQIRRPYYCWQAATTKALCKSAFFLFLLESALFGPFGCLSFLLTQYSVPGATGQSSLYQISPGVLPITTNQAFQPLNLNHSDTCAGLFYISRSIKFALPVWSTTFWLFSYCYSVLLYPLTLKWDDPDPHSAIVPAFLRPPMLFL